MKNKDLFMLSYKDNLINARMNYPDMYTWPRNQLDMVFKHMIEAIERGCYNKDSIALKNTCKQLNIKHTYKAINEFLNKEEGNEENE